MTTATATTTAPQVSIPAALPVATDIFGKQINPRDMIVYATRRGSETFLNKLSVTTVNSDSIRGFNPDDINRRIRVITSLATVAKVS